MLKLNKKRLPITVSKKLLILGFTNGRCTFATSKFPAENPRTQNRTILIHKR